MTRTGEARPGRVADRPRTTAQALRLLARTRCLRLRGGTSSLVALTLAIATACSSPSPRPGPFDGDPTDPPGTPSAAPTLTVDPDPSSPEPSERLRTVRLVAAGDIACSADHDGDGDDGENDSDSDRDDGEQTGCVQQATSDLVGDLDPTVVMPLGDTQYQRATLANYRTSYGPTWGRYLKITRPVIGNHEYFTRGARDYFHYFGRAAGDPVKGYYSFDVGSWHVVVLNSQCVFVGGCEKGSPQERWLRNDLAANKTRCTLAAWHEPRRSSGDHLPNVAVDALWRDLAAAGAEIVLSGHDHNYERLAPLDGSGRVDEERGIRQFIVGTGGVGLRPLRARLPETRTRQNTHFGVLALTLRPRGYSWRFVSTEPGYTDRGQGRCH